MSPIRRDTFRQRPALRCWTITFGVAILLSSAWILASPLASGPDEPAHVVRAAAVWHGELVGKPDVQQGGGLTEVKVPRVLDRLREMAQCFAFKPHKTPGCSGAFEGDTSIGPVQTSAGKSPPLFYALVGAPIAFSPSVVGVYLTRFFGAVFAAAAFATGITVAARSRSPFLLMAVFVAITPTAVYLTGVLNPSSLEISSSIAVWVSTLVLFRGGVESPGLRRALPWIVSGSAAVFVLSRQLSPLWLALIAITCAITTPRRDLAALARSSTVRRGTMIVAISGALAVAWLLVERPLAAEKATGYTLNGVDSFGYSVGHLGDDYRSAIGYFGWLDVTTPFITYIAWIAAAAVLVVLCITLCSARIKVALLVIAILSGLVPAAIEASQLGALGPTWQGRYSLPLIVGIVLVAGAGLDEIERSVRTQLSRLARPLLFALAVGHFVCFYVTLRRYMVSIDGAIWFVGGQGWGPPLPAGALLALGVIGTGAFYLWADRLIRETRAASETVSSSPQ